MATTTIGTDTEPGSDRRAVLSRRIRWFVAATITYNVIEAVVAITAAADVSCRHTCPHPSQRYRRTVTSRIVGRQPNGLCASRRVVESRGRPCSPHRAHVMSPSMIRQASTARSGCKN